MAIDDNTSYELTGAQVKDLANKIKAKAADNIFVGATSAIPGSKGLVPQPQAGDDTKFLSGDGTWKTAGGSSSGTVFYQGTSGSVVTLYSDQAKTQVATAQDVADAVAAGATYISVDPAGDLASVVFCYPMPGLTGQYLFRATTGPFVMELISTSTTTYIQNNTTLQEKLNAGSNISISGNTISATDTTYSDFTGATSSIAGSEGLVPAPAAGDQNKLLKGDGTWARQGEEFIGEFTTGSSFTLPTGYKIYHIRGFAQYSGASSNSNMWMTRTNRTGTDWLRRINGSAGGVQWGEWSYTDGHFILLGSSDALSINGGKVMVDLTITVTNSTLWMASGNFSHSGSQDSGISFSETRTSDASVDTTLQFVSTGRTFQDMDIVVTGIKDSI